MVVKMRTYQLQYSNNCSRSIRVTRVLFYVFLSFQLASSGIIHRIFGARKCGDPLLFICSAFVSLLSIYQGIVFSDIRATFNKCRVHLRHWTCSIRRFPVLYPRVNFFSGHDLVNAPLKHDDQTQTRSEPLFLAGAESRTIGLARQFLCREVSFRKLFMEVQVSTFLFCLD